MQTEECGLQRGRRDERRRPEDWSRADSVAALRERNGVGVRWLCAPGISFVYLDAGVQIGGQEGKPLKVTGNCPLQPVITHCFLLILRQKGAKVAGWHEFCNAFYRTRLQTPSCLSLFATRKVAHLSTRRSLVRALGALLALLSVGMGTVGVGLFPANAANNSLRRESVSSAPSLISRSLQMAP